MSYPMIGNYGVNDGGRGHRQVYARGIVMHQMSPEPSNWRATESLYEYLSARAWSAFRASIPGRWCGTCAGGALFEA